MKSPHSRKGCEAEATSLGGWGIKQRESKKSYHLRLEGTNIEDQRAQSGAGVLGEGAASPLPNQQERRLGNALSSPIRVRPLNDLSVF